MHRRWGWLAILTATAAIALTACGGGSSSQQVASLRTTSGTGNTGATVSLVTKRPTGDPTALLDKWATCMRNQGDPGQADPTIDAYGGITIHLPANSEQLSAAVHAGADPCNRYVAAAQSALRAAHPVAAPPDQSQILKYVNCMRANGVPNYPDPTGNKTHFNGSGVDPNSPSVVKISIKCGNKLGLPRWWSAGWGPPGDVSVQTGHPPGAPPLGSPLPARGAYGNGG